MNINLAMCITLPHKLHDNLSRSLKILDLSSSFYTLVFISAGKIIVVLNITYIVYCVCRDILSYLII